MKDALPRTIYLEDYRVSNYLIDRTELCFLLGDEFTTVTTKLHVRRNPDCVELSAEALVLDGSASLQLLSIAVDGRVLNESDYRRDEDTLTLWGLSERAFIETTVQIKPQLNTSLNGLYQSRGMYCTQCEAQGFRQITFYLDRPDIMSEFSTRIVADEQRYPVLLSNGNCIAKESLDDGQHAVTWHDPFVKPAYLFALVAGTLAMIEDIFVTCSGRTIALKIYVEDKDKDKCAHAMTSLKKSMRWDEQVYGREYDLDIFMIVAVDDFNMGAMENKGLNIFNTAAVLANQATTMDATF
ncbi:MAG TPA: aminopeptidase N, partial [Porticoccaceae bacterium]|nr:aminopeptidase N [Porticoccaceae bacterium]